MKLSFYLYCLLCCGMVSSQRSTFFVYYFKAFTADRKTEIKPSDKTYQVNSLLVENFHGSNIDERLSYGNWDNSIDKWEIVEADSSNRKLVLLQIVNTVSKDTMRVITDTDDGTEWNNYRLRFSIDSIYFAKGNFKIVNEPTGTTGRYRKKTEPISDKDLVDILSKKMITAEELQKTLYFLYKRID